MQDLGLLLASLQPVLRDGAFAFVTVAPEARLDGFDVVASVREDAGLSLIVPLAQARDRGLAVTFEAAWITLAVASELAVVGLTAAVSRALADAGIACNVVAGAAHDHLFVPFARRADALRCLQELQRGHA